MVQGRLIEKMIFEQKFVGSEGIGHVDICGKIFLDKENSQCEGLKVGM